MLFRAAKFFMKLQIPPHKVVLDKSGFTAARAEFAARHCILLRQAVEPEFI